MKAITKKIIKDVLFYADVMFLTNQAEKYFSTRQTVENLIHEHAKMQCDQNVPLTFEFIEPMFAPNMKIKIYIVRNPKKYCLIKFNVTRFRNVKALYDAIDEAIGKLTGEAVKTYEVCNTCQNQACTIGCRNCSCHLDEQKENKFAGEGLTSCYCLSLEQGEKCTRYKPIKEEDEQ